MLIKVSLIRIFEKDKTTGMPPLLQSGVRDYYFKIDAANLYSWELEVEDYY